MDELRLNIQLLRRFPSQGGPSTTLLPFVPEADLFALLSQVAITDALADPAFQLESHQCGHVAGEVVDGARKIFAILVELKLEANLNKCLEKCLADSSLPILEVGRLREIFHESAPLFEQLQWQYIPLKFREGAHKDLEPDRILPYTRNTRISSGGFSTVFKSTIHPSYQDWDHSLAVSVSHNRAKERAFDDVIQGIELVRKEISSRTSYEVQRRESDLLFLLRSLQNENIVQLVTSYTQNGFCNLLFPVAECDLYDLLMSPQQPEWTKKSEEVTDSLRGLVSGLDYLHNFRPLATNVDDTERITKHGYHHDIKPRNILVKGSRLILADFGLSRLKNADQDTQTIWKNRPPTYSAPEACDPVTLHERSVGRAYDIWSFGCVLSELVTYALEGAEGVETFRREREQEGVYGRDNCFHCKGERSPAVSAWFSKMEDRHCASSQAFLFKISSNLLVADPCQRPRSEELVQIFDSLSLRRRFEDVLHNASVLSPSSGGEGIFSVYLMKLSIENMRLRAWGYAVGLYNINQMMQPWSGKISDNYDQIYLNLKKCSINLLECETQINQRAVQQRILTILMHTNEDLLFGLPDSVTNVIENTFQLLTVSTGNNVQLLVDSASNSESLAYVGSSTAEEQSLSRHQEAGLLAAARFVSQMFNAMGANFPDGAVRIIDPSFIHDGPRLKDIYLDSLSVSWYYRSFRTDDKQRVLVEERSYQGRVINFLDDTKIAESGQEVFERIKELAHLFQMPRKPKQMRLLSCLGIFHLPALTKVGFVYDFPSAEGEELDQEPTCLSNVIQYTKDADLNPTLNNKFALSQAITACIHSLHLTGWLHKSISSSNLIYFRKKHQKISDLNICEPYLVGFQRSRPSRQTAYSDLTMSANERAFVHPSYQEGVRFHSAFDYYSLGVILLEIALWRPIDKVIAPGRSADARKLSLLEIATKYVPQRMGTSYCEAVLACLKFYDDNASEMEETKLLMKFQHDILEKLQRAGLAT